MNKRHIKIVFTAQVLSWVVSFVIFFVGFTFGLHGMNTGIDPRLAAFCGLYCFISPVFFMVDKKNNEDMIKK